MVTKIGLVGLGLMGHQHPTAQKEAPPTADAVGGA